MTDFLIWVYIVNASLLVVHEIDSGYQREWEMMHLPGKAGGFLLIHLPLVGLILWGLVLLARAEPAGYWYSLVLGGVGVFAFCLHGAFHLAGHPSFRQAISRLILLACLLVSLLQLVLTWPHL